MGGRASDDTGAAARATPGATPEPPVDRAATLGRAVPSFALILVADLAALWAAVSGSWTVLAVVDICIVDGLADGFFAWLRARAAWAAGATDDPRDRTLVKEFLRTYLVVIVVMLLVAYMVFTGKLLKPGGETPLDPAGALATWQFWAVAAGLFAMRGLVYFWDFVRGGEAGVVPPAAVVSEPLRRLFVLQFGVLVGGLIVFWVFDSSVTGLAVILGAKTAVDLGLAVLERVRVARIKAAVAFGMTTKRRPPEASRAPRAGRRRH